MGFANLVLVDPMRYEDPTHFEREARRLAWQAVDVLDRRRTIASLDEALAPFGLVAGTSSRPPDTARPLGPRALASEISRRLHADTTACAALLFGQEDIGLTKEALARCNLVGSIPAAPAYPSLNLAQAALLFLYELRLELTGHASGAGPSHHDAPLSMHGQLDAFYGRLERALDEIGFFQGTAKPHMMRELRSIFNRTLLTPRELAILEGLVRQTVWAARRRD